jgi:ornithine carbamoyltransferase
LWGPPTNVFRSWHELALVLGINIIHVCAERWHRSTPHVLFQSSPPAQADVVITDGWPAGAEGDAISLTEAHLAAMDSPVLLPTPPFIMGRELDFDPGAYPRFAGYRQKALLLPVQMAVVRYLLDATV